MSGDLTLADYEAAADRIKVPGCYISLYPLDKYRVRVSVNQCLGVSTHDPTREVNFRATAEIDLRYVTVSHFMNGVARLWFEVAIHEACERFTIDDERYFDPHTEVGYANYLCMLNTEMGIQDSPSTPYGHLFVGMTG